MTPSTPSPAARSLPLITVVSVVAILYFGREFFLPLALAILISFVLAPVTRRFEHWGLGRVPAVILATLLAFSVVGGVGYTIAGQVMDLANALPTYRNNIHAKIVSLKTKNDSPWNHATETLRDLSSEFTKPEATPDPKTEATPLTASTSPTATPSPGATPSVVTKPVVPTPSNSGNRPAATPPSAAAQLEGTASSEGNQSKTREDAKAKATPPPDKVVKVEVTNSPGGALDTLKTFIAPIAGPLGTAAVVIAFVIFMLLEREDLRDRIIHLIGRGRLHLTTQAIDEAGERVSRYLIAQCIVNVSYGLPIGFGLWLIGVPNAPLWGLLAALLRFVPYVGAWIASSFPIVLSLAIAPSWNAPALTLGLFIVVELFTNNVIEPWLYGSSTGLSAMAIVVAAVFWAWLWGPVGLLLATPLTVCIAVIGKYIPTLSFLEVLLGDKPPIAVSDRFYQRLLALDSEEVSRLTEEYTAENTLAKTFDEVIIPALRLVDAEHRGQHIDDASVKEMRRLVRDQVADLGEQELARIKKANPERAAVVPNVTVPFLSLPASNESDELAALMLTQLLIAGGLIPETVSSKSLAGEMVETAAKLQPKLLCISVMPPDSVLPAQHLSRRLRERLGKETRLLVGVWNDPPAEHERRVERFKRAEADEVFASVGRAAHEILLLTDCNPRVA